MSAKLELRLIPPFTKQQVENWIADKRPTPFHVYDSEGFLGAARDFNSAFEWVGKYSRGFKNFFLGHGMTFSWTGFPPGLRPRIAQIIFWLPVDIFQVFRKIGRRSFGHLLF